MRSLHIATREWPLLAATREKLAPSNKKKYKVETSMLKNVH